MFRKITTMVKSVSAVIRFGLLTLRYAGLKVALRKLGHQIYGRAVFLYFTSDLEEPAPPPTFPCYTVRASTEDVNEFFEQMCHESNEGKYQILVRKWYHEKGLGTPYVQKTLDTNELCCIRWIVTAQDIKQSGFGDRLPMLHEEEVMSENVYTLERFRNKGVQTSSQMREILQGMGFKRRKACVAEDNIPELHFLKRRGRMISEKVLERHMLFRVSRKTLERYDPPIPITLPGEN